MVIKRSFWKNQKVFITGHTGFKGSWMSIFLTMLGAEVFGYALEPPTEPNLFGIAKVNTIIKDIRGDIRDISTLRRALTEIQPSVVIHMAAQSLVRESYKYPVETFQTNIMGTINCVEVCRELNELSAFLCVTSDKCYENKEILWGYREVDPLGGKDPYSSSKACAEIVANSYRHSFFNAEKSPIIASARAGNVIGGGDWAKDRLVPDLVRAIMGGKEVRIRNPKAVRPWQFVLEPLCGYLRLVEKMVEVGEQYAEGWNFGPEDSDAVTVSKFIDIFYDKWGKVNKYEQENDGVAPEACFLKLDCSKSKQRLGWAPRYDLNKALGATIEWYKQYINGANMMDLCEKQIEQYLYGEKQ